MRMQYMSKTIMKIQHLSQLRRRPGTQQQSARTDDWGLETRLAVVDGGVEGEGVEPDSVAGAAETVFLFCAQPSPVHAVLAAPFEARVRGCPGFGHAAYLDQAFEQGEGLGWGRAGDVGCL